MAAAPLFSGGNTRVDEIMAGVNEIAVLPHAVYKVMEISGLEDTSAAEIERAIIVDPGFSARILALANSAYMALPKKVTSIRDAIMFCGVKSVRELAMTVGVYDMFVGKGDKESLRRRGWWRHSVDTAVCAKYIAGRMRNVPPDEAYTCGLLHLMGKSLLCRFGGEDYEQVENLVDADFPLLEAEREVYGTDHIELAIAASYKWGFPAVIRSGMTYVEAPSIEEDHPKHRAIVALSNRIANFVIEGNQGDQRGVDAIGAPDWTLQILDLSSDNFKELVDGAVAAMASAKGLTG